MANLTLMKVDRDLVDRISSLPHDILLPILSSLRVKEQARTSILSKGWRYLWTFSSSLDFDASETFKEVLDGKKNQFIESEKYVYWVNEALKLHKALNIRKFRVCFQVNKLYADDIERWVNFVSGKNLEELELNCGVCSSVYPLKDNYFKGMTSLKSLCLASIDISADLLESILYECVLLERVSVMGSGALLNLVVPKSLIKLKYLEISRCRNMKRLDIHAQNIESFAYTEQMIHEIHFHELLCLQELSLGPYLYLNFLESRVMSDHRSILVKLSLDLRLTFTDDHTSCPLFPNLKCLLLKVSPDNYMNLLIVAGFLEACPSLVELKVLLHWISSPRSTRKMHENNVEKIADEDDQLLNKGHHALKWLELVGFKGHWAEEDLVLFLIQHAVSLEKIILDTQNLVLSTERAHEYNMKRERAKQLMLQTPPHIDMVII